MIVGINALVWKDNARFVDKMVTVVGLWINQQNTSLEIISEKVIVAMNVRAGLVEHIVTNVTHIQHHMGQK